MKLANPLRRKKNRSIASKQLEIFLLFIAVPVLTILTLFAFFFRYRIVEITKNQQEITLRQYASGINVEFQNISIITSSLFHSAALMDSSKALVNAQTPEQRYRASPEIEKIFQTYSILLRQLVGFCLIFEDDSAPFISRNYAGIDLSKDEIETYTGMADAAPGLIVFPDILTFSYRQQSGWYIASMAVAPQREIAAPGFRTLIVSFVINPLESFIRQNNPMQDYFLTGRNGKVLASGDVSAVGRDIAEIKEKYKKSWIIIEAPVEITGWTLCSMINVRSLTNPLDVILYILYLALLIIVLLFIRYNTSFFARILTPIKILSSRMEDVGNGNFSVRVESGNVIELNKISESFNYMVEKISMLTEAIKEENRERTRTEIEALRYQLNPHFLCNALNAIRMMAIMTKNDAIGKMSAALMMITEDTLAREDAVYPLEHELYILDNYMYIMKVRYGDAFELIRDVDVSLLKLGIPSMILQPLIENAIQHGFRGLSRHGLIVVSAVIDRAIVDREAAGNNAPALVISVRDNGNGIPGEKLSGIFNKDETRPQGLRGIGLYNVRRRIALLYGGSYGLEAASFPGEGTVITLRLPVQEAEGHEGRIMSRIDASRNEAQ